MIINVFEGKDKPYQCRYGFYMRLGANSQKLTRDEIIDFGVHEGKIRFDEQICNDFDFKNFDEEKFEYYLKLARITDVLDEKAILQVWDEHILLRRGNCFRVPVGTEHRLIGLDEPCRVLEIAQEYHDQVEDIVRIEDEYGRKNKKGDV